MSLAPGVRLGTYEIVALLGAALNHPNIGVNWLEELKQPVPHHK